jgi:acetyl-CoA/propionyl-CoA carboxylase carboxyl transferase subunit
MPVEEPGVTFLDDPVARMEKVVDGGSLVLDPERVGSGVRSGRGRVLGAPVVVFSCDPRSRGGALGSRGSDVIVRAVDGAVLDGVPVVGVWHSGGARLQDGTSSLDGVGRIFRALSLADGKVLRVSVVLGPAAGGAAYGPALTDVVVMGPAGRIFVTGPDVVRAVTGELVDAGALGGPEVHTRRSGVVHLAEPSDLAALERARSLVGLLADPLGQRGHDVADQPGLRHVLPVSTRSVYDVHDVVDLLLDAQPRVELQRRWAPNLVTLLGRLGERPVGVVANNPIHLAGCLDCSASEKAAAFVRRCDALGVPLVVLADVPGYLPGRDQEEAGIVSRGATLLHAFSRCTVPRVTVILRKAYGGAFIAMNSRSLGASGVVAWPTAEVGVMYPRGAVEIIHRRRLAATPPSRRPGLIAELARQYEAGAGGLERALTDGQVDDVIDPATTPQVVAALIDQASRPASGNGHVRATQALTGETDWRLPASAEGPRPA